MSNTNKRTSLLLNWYANPYHTPIFVAKQLGFYKEQAINLSIIQPTDPSDVTELVGQGSIDLGLKAMVHCYAARSRKYPVKSIGTLMDEPPTGLIFSKKSSITSFNDIIGKKLGYVGEFGKIMIDDLAKRAGIATDQYETVRVGMNVANAISKGIIDAGIGIGCFQKVELEFNHDEIEMLRIDELAGLGCCCFCSVMFIAREQMLEKESLLLKKFMKATQRGLSFTLENPHKAYEHVCQEYPKLDTPLYKKIFVSCLPFFSRTLLNTERDWEKVGLYAERLQIVPKNYDPKQCYTNKFIPEIPYAACKPIIRQPLKSHA